MRTLLRPDSGHRPERKERKRKRMSSAKAINQVFDRCHRFLQVQCFPLIAMFDQPMTVWPMVMWANDEQHRYQKERVTFVQSVADLANQSQNVEALQNAGVMSLLRPLLLDNVPSVQLSAALALGRLASHSGELAEAVVSKDILPQLVHSLSENNRFHKKAASFVLRAVSKHSAPLAQAVSDAGALDALVNCLEESDPGVKEAAAWALGYVAGHTRELATAVAQAGALSLLVLCVQEADVSLKRIAASSLSDIAKHAPELAQSVVDAGAVPFLAPLVGSHDAKLKRQACSALSHIAKHSGDLANVVVEASVFPGVLTSLQDGDALVCKHSATCVREICKHSPDLAQLVVSHGGASSLTEFVGSSKGNACLPGVMAIGFIAAFGEALAESLHTVGAVSNVTSVLSTEEEDHLRAASAWTLGQLGRHTPHHAKTVSDTGSLSLLINAFGADEATDDLRKKCYQSLQHIFPNLTDTHALDTALREELLDESLVLPIVEQLSKVLPNDPQGRKDFVLSGGFAKVQQLHVHDGSELADAIESINSCYPVDDVQYYSPADPDQILQKLDQMTTNSTAQQQAV